MIGAGPKNINKDFLIPGGQKIISKGGALNFLGKSSAKNDFQSLIDGELTSNEEVSGNQSKGALTILSENGLLGKKDVASKKHNLVQVENGMGEITSENGDHLEKLLGQKKVTPLKLGLSSGNNQKYEKKIEEFLQNKKGPGLIKNPNLPTMKNQRENIPFNPYNMDRMENPVAINNVNAHLNKYQKFSIKDKNNIVKPSTGDNKSLKNSIEANDNSASVDNLLDFTLKQDLSDGSNGHQRFSEHKSLMPELHLMKNEKVLNMDQLNSNDPKALIDKISNYIVEKSFASKDSIDLTVKHNELGEFRINASRLKQGDRIDLEIITSSDKGHRFFTDNESAMVKSLSNSGLKIADLKISTGHESHMSSQDGNSSSREQSFFSKTAQYSFDEKPESYDEDSQRRKMLWELFKERKEA